MKNVSLFIFGTKLIKFRNRNTSYVYVPNVTSKLIGYILYGKLIGKFGQFFFPCTRQENVPCPKCCDWGWNPGHSVSNPRRLMLVQGKFLFSFDVWMIQSRGIDIILSMSTSFVLYTKLGSRHINIFKQEVLQSLGGI